MKEKNIKGISKKNLKCAYYCRVATKDQLRIKEQEKDIKKYCNDKKYSFIKRYVDIGYSANNKERPSFNRMLEDLKNGKINKIVTSDISRIARNTDDISNFFKEVELYNATFEIVNCSDSDIISLLNIILEEGKNGRKRRRNKSCNL